MSTVQSQGAIAAPVDTPARLKLAQDQSGEIAAGYARAASNYPGFRVCTCSLHGGSFTAPVPELTRSKLAWFCVCELQPHPVSVVMSK